MFMPSPLPSALPIMLLIILQIADILSTFYALRGGNAREANPVVLWFIERFGLFPGLLISKATIVAPVIYIGANHSVALWIAVAAYVLVLINNLVVLKRQ